MFTVSDTFDYTEHVWWCAKNQIGVTSSISAIVMNSVMNSGKTHMCTVILNIWSDFVTCSIHPVSKLSIFPKRPNFCSKGNNAHLKIRAQFLDKVNEFNSSLRIHFEDRKIIDQQKCFNIRAGFKSKSLHIEDGCFDNLRLMTNSSK